MSTYFRIFPQLFYRFGRSGSPLLTQDVTKRFITLNRLMKQKYVFYPYVVKDGERPDIIAHKYYNDPSLDWLILMVNDRYDPMYDWVLDYTNFNKYIVKKYGSIETAKQTPHSYYIVINDKEETGYRQFTEQKLYEVDFQTFNTTPMESRRMKTVYDYEEELNEAKRNILLLDKDFIPSIKAEYEKIFLS